jgi:hypothetical protein
MKIMDNPLFNPGAIRGKVADNNQFSIIVKKK